MSNETEWMLEWKQWAKYDPQLHKLMQSLASIHVELKDKLPLLHRCLGALGMSLTRNEAAQVDPDGTGKNLSKIKEPRQSQPSQAQNQGSDRDATQRLDPRVLKRLIGLDEGAEQLLGGLRRAEWPVRETLELHEAHIEWYRGKIEWIEQQVKRLPQSSNNETQEDVKGIDECLRKALEIGQQMEQQLKQLEQKEGQNAQAANASHTDQDAARQMHHQPHPQYNRHGPGSAAPPPHAYNTDQHHAYQPPHDQWQQYHPHGPDHAAQPFGAPSQPYGSHDVTHHFTQYGY